MFKLSDLDRKLTIKLGDPLVTNSDGEIFSSEIRKNYIARAYVRLIRILKKTLRNKAPLFVYNAKIDKFKIKNDRNDFEGSQVDLSKNNVDKIEEAYVTIKENNKDVTKSILIISNNSWLSTIYGISDLYSPTIQKAIYGTLLNNKLLIYPQLEDGTEVIINYIGMPEYISSETNNDTIINIPAEYVDMLLLLAASEGMMDIARQDKVTLYMSDFNNQLQILAGWMNLELQLEGKHSGI